MTGKRRKKDLKNTLRKKLQSCLRTELAVVNLASDGKAFLNEDDAINYQSSLESERQTKIKKAKMVDEIVKAVSDVIKANDWGLFFRGEPIRSLPTQDDGKFYKINEIKLEHFEDKLKDYFSRKRDECQNTEEKQTDS